MTALIVLLMALAGLGFFTSIVVHVIALTGNVPPGVDAVFVMHFGVFLVWLPAMFISMRRRDLQQTRFARRSLEWAFTGCPSWMKYAAYALFGYTFLNFFLTFNGGAGPATGAPGEATSLRAFSGHWMLFYAVAFGMLCSAFRERLFRRSCARVPGLIMFVMRPRTSGSGS